MKKNVIVFEVNSGFLNFILTLYYILRRFDVIFVYSEKSFEEKRWFSFLLNKGLIKKLGHDIRLSVLNYYYPDMAFDNIDTLYKEISGKRLIKKAVEFYGNVNIEQTFRKELHKYLSRFYYINRMMYEAERLYPGSRILYVPSSGLYYRRTDSNESFTYKGYMRLLEKSGAAYYKTERSSFPAVLIAFSYAKYFLNKIKIFIKAILVSAWILAAAMLKKKEPSRVVNKRYRYAIMIINQARQFGSKLRKVDWLLDGVRITNKNTLFISNNKLSPVNISYMQKNGLIYEDDVLTHISLPDAVSCMRHLSYLLKYAFMELMPISDIYLNLCVIFAKWNGFCRCFCVDNLISHGDYGIQSVARNIVLKKNNPVSKTWHYMDAGSFQGYFSRNADYEFRTPSFSFAYYDYLVAWSKKTGSYLASHHIIGEIRISGCLWADNINYAVEKGFARILREDLKKHGYAEKQKIVTFFDSTFLDWSLTNYADGISFARDMLRLLDEIKDAYVVLKVKYPLQQTKGLCRPLWELYKKISERKNAGLISHHISSSEAIALGDLAVSYPFTSTTFEALSAGKKAIYYDPNSKFQNSYFDQIPHLVCHGYQELFSEVQRLLFEIDEDAYKIHIRKFAAECLDPYMDGKAIPRFRDFLTSANRMNVSEARNPASSCTAMKG